MKSQIPTDPDARVDYYIARDAREARQWRFVWFVIGALVAFIIGTLCVA